MRKKELEKIGAVGIVLIFVFGAFVPAVGSVGKNGEPVTSSSVVRKGEEVSLIDSVGVRYDTLVNTYFQTAILGLVSIAFNNPLLNQLREFFTGQGKSNDGGVSDSGGNQIDDDKTFQEQDTDLVDSSDPPLPLNPSDPWWDTDWSYRKEITIDHTKVAATLANFPVLISFSSDADLASKAQSDGDDIVFVNNATGTKLNHEIELYTSITGKLVCWVNVTSLSSTENTILYMYYGNPSCSNQENPEGVWDSYYVMVQHLCETTGMQYDSTSYDNDGTPTVTTQGTATGKIDGADVFNGASAGDDINIPDSASLSTYTNGLTASAWIKLDVVAGSRRQGIFCKNNNAPQSSWLFEYQDGVNGHDLLFLNSADGTNYKYEYAELNPVVGTWYLVTVVWSPNVIPKIYRNGTLLADDGNGGAIASIYDSTTPLLIGEIQYNAARNFDGVIDEARVSNIARSEGWLSTEYNNQNNPSTFYTIGNEEVPSVPSENPIVSDPHPENMQTLVPISLSELNFTLADNQADLMDYSVTMVPDVIGGPKTGSDVASNSTIHIPITGGPLAYDTTYIWRVNVTDGSHWTNETFMFTTEVEPGLWWNTSWLYRKAITIDHTKVTGTLTNFPVLVSFNSDADLSDHAQSDGDDIVFINVETGTQLNHEIESFDSVSGELVCWVNVTSLSSTEDTILYMYYDNPSCTSQENPLGVWDSHYVMVQHLSETSGTCYDSTSYDNDGTPNGGVNQDVVGYIDGADGFDGVNDNVSVPHDGSLAGFTVGLTVSAWIKLDVVAGRRQFIVSKQNNPTNQGWFFEYQEHATSGKVLNFLTSQDGTSYKYMYYRFEPTVGTWYHVVAVWQPNVVGKCYVNGALATQVVNGGTVASIYNNVGEPLLIGACSYNSSRNFDGVIDEVRVSNIARSEGWLSTEYNNQQNPGSFYIVGNEELSPGYPMASNPSPVNGATGIPVSLSELSFTLIDYENDVMNYTVTMIPDVIGGPQSGANIVSGTTIHIPITGGPLDYGTTYPWRVNLTDGVHWTNVSYSFTTIPENPVISDLYPQDMAVDIRVSLLQVNFTLFDYQNDVMSYTVAMTPDVIGGPQSGTGVANGTAIHIPILGGSLDYSTTYTWFVNVSDGVYWTNETFRFTTTNTPVFTSKWNVSVGVHINRYFATADVNGDNKKEILVVSERGHFIRAYDSTNGSLLWNHYDANIKSAVEGIRLEVGDLNNDGIPEVVCGLEPAGVLALHANNGSVYWRLTGLDGASIRGNPLIFDLDLDGYPTIFIPTWDVSYSAIYSIRYDGVINCKNNKLDRVCAGGISVMDYDNDGHFEVYAGDFNLSNNLTGRVKSFWAENLTLRCESEPVFSFFSIGISVLADVTGDGVKEVITAHGDEISGNDHFLSYYVMSADDLRILQVVEPGDENHVFEPAVYDIDGDGHMELIASGGAYLTVYDLVTKTRDFRTSISSAFFQPTVGDVTGDGVMELLCPSGNLVRIFDKTFTQIASLPLVISDNYCYASVDDVDNDGYSEIIVQVGGYLQVFDTDAPAPDGGVRSGLARYSEYRQGVAEYVTVLGLKDEQPSRGSTGVLFNPLLSVNVTDYQFELMDITFRTNTSGSWQDITTYGGVGNGVYTASSSGMSSIGARYYWSVNATDGYNTWTNMTYSFTTVADEPGIFDPSPVNGATDISVSLSELHFTLIDYQDDLMNYTVTVTPDVIGGPQSDTDIANGTTIHISITGGPLDYDTTYTWWVNVTDGAHWTNRTYSFTTQNVPVNNPPIVTNPNPTNMSTGLPFTLSLLTVTIQDPEGKRINWTITTSPNIGSSAGTNEFNGTKNCTISGLTYSTIYYWTVKANDGSKWTNTTLSFTTELEPGLWWNSGWLYRKEITIDHTKVTGTLTNFPMLISFASDANLSGNAQSDGDDIVFINGETGVKLNYEIESFDSVSGKLVCWVNVTSLSSTEDTILYMYYGNPGCSNQENPGGVWNTGYVMVQHLDETSGPQYDSTYNNNNGIQENGVNQDASGMINGADDFDGINDAVVIPHDSSLVFDTGDEISVSAWINPDDYDDYSMIICKEENTTNNRNFGLYPFTGLPAFIYRNNAGTTWHRYEATPYNTVPTNSWTYVTATYTFGTGSSAKLYMNGNIITGSWSLGNGNEPPWHGTSYTRIGRRATGQNPLCLFDGTIDEVRLSKVTRSAGWIKTEYNNQYDPSTFYYIGAEEILPGYPRVTNPHPVDGATYISISLSELSFTLLDYEEDMMSYTVTMDPDVIGGLQSDADIVNGTTVHILITGGPLDCSVTYTWQVNVTDGVYWTNKTFTFTSVPDEPIVTNLTPYDGGTGIPISLSELSFTLIDYQNDLMNYTVTINPDVISGSQIGSNIANGTTIFIPITDGPLSDSTTYTWFVNVTDGVHWTNKTFSFMTVIPAPFSIKWYSYISRGIAMQCYVADLNGDNIKDIIQPCSGGMLAVNGVDGSQLWWHAISGASHYSQAEIGDLNNDGIPEIVTSTWTDGKVVAIHGNNGTRYWTTSLYGSDGAFNNLLIFDYDNSGYPHIFLGDRGSGASVYKISYNGIIEASHPATHCCAGGVTAADTDNDGHFEIYFADDVEIESYWAENFTLRWKSHYPVSGYRFNCGSGCSAIVDCNGDGIKDIVHSIQRISPQNIVGVAVVSGKDGSIIKADHNIFSRYMYLNHQVVYDIDLDGNPEWLHSDYNYVTAYDLNKMKIEFQAPANSERWAPVVADVTGDGKMELVVVNFDHLTVYDNNYHLVARIPESGSLPGSSTTSLPVVTDQDNDGLNEIVISRFGGNFMVIETNAPAKFGGSIAEKKGYSIYRQGVAQYISILGLKDEQPPRNSVNISFNPTLSVNITNWMDEQMDITFRTNATGTWQNIGGYTNVGDGTYNIAANMDKSDTWYYWSVNVTDRKNTWTNMTYKFKTLALAPVVSNLNPRDHAIYVSISTTSLSFNLADYQGDLMNYSVETVPDVGNGNGYNVGNGRYSITVTNLTYSTTYTWYLNAIDGTYWTNNIYTFTTEKEPVTNPFVQGWKYRKEITIDHQKVSCDLANFPVLISITDLDLVAHAQTDGDDIIFMVNMPEALQLYHEIEYYNSSDGKIVAWVNVPNLSSITDTELYMYYGNPTTESYENPLKVWDSNYVMIQHLNETSGIDLDSTSYGNNGIPFDGVKPNVIGIIDGAAGFNGTKNYYGYYSNDYIDCGNDDSLDISSEITIEAWVKRTDNGTGNYPGIVSRAQETSSGSWNRYQLRYKPADQQGQFFLGDGAGYKIVGSNSDIPSNTWTHLVGSWDGTTMKLFVNGIQQTNTGIFTGTPVFSSAILEIGRYTDADYFHGSIDEVRVSNIDRSACWIATEYNNQHNPGDFYNVGSETTFTELMVFEEVPQNGSVNVDLNPVLSIHVFDAQGDSLNIFFRTNVSGNWITIGSNLGVYNDIYYCFNTSSMNSYSKKYWWSVNITDSLGSGNWTNKTYCFTTRPDNYPPVLSSPLPDDGATGIAPGDIQLSITVSDLDNELMDVIFRTNASGNWMDINTINDQPGGTYSQIYTFTKPIYKYYWSVNCSDGKTWTNSTYIFTTGLPPTVHVFAINHTAHMDYGCSYPMTYVFNLTTENTELHASKYDGYNWILLPIKNQSQIQNGIEAVRFNYDLGKAYISVAFPAERDYFILKITDENDNIVDSTYAGITKYYDDKQMAVVMTVDDWYDRYHEYFMTAIDRCQARNVWITPGIVTVGSAVYGGQPANRTDMQQQIDEGYVEPSSHSMYHLHPSYDQAQWGVQSSYDEEINGSKQNLINDLIFPSLSRRGDQEYLYAWLEPYGEIDNTIRQKLGEYRYLCDRSVGLSDTFSTWDNTNGLFNRVGYAIDIESVRDLTTLNSKFYNVYSSGGIYHMFGHARNNDFISGDVALHLNYISNRSDVWYVGFGHLYLYHYLQERNVIEHTTTIGNIPPALTSESPVNKSAGIPIGTTTLQVRAVDINSELMNIIFKTNATGSWQVIGSNNSVSNGVYQQTYTFPDYDTTYWWSVNCTDGTSWTNQTYSFTTRPENYISILSTPLPANGEGNIPIGDVNLTITVNDPDGNLMDITFRTNVSGTWSTIGINSSQPNGTYTQTYTFSNSAYRYYWSVNCTDGKAWVNQTYSFATGRLTVMNPFTQGWLYRKKIIIDHEKVSCDLINFPVLINITDPDLRDKAQPDGIDILFMDNDGVANLLDHEIEYYNSTTGLLIAWVNIAQLSSAVDTILYMYYANPGSVNQQNPKGVWDTDYVMVQHLNETSGIHYDSTIYGNDGINQGSNQDIFGKIDGANSFDGINDYIDCGNKNSLNINNALTLEAWVKRTGDGTGVFPSIISRANPTTGNYNRYQLRYKPADNVAQFFLGDSTSYVIVNSNNDLTLGVWTHLVATWDGSSMKLFVNGVQQTSTGIFTSSPSFTSEVLELGRYTSLSYLSGDIDEIRISNVKRSACWITTEYNNQQNPDNFYSVQNEEIPSLAPLITNENPQDKSVHIDLYPALSIHAEDLQGDTMNILFRTNATGTWLTIGSNLTVNNGTYYCLNTSTINNYLTTYYWSINATDPTGSGHWTNQTYTFTTRIENNPPTVSNPVPANGSTGIPIGNIQLGITANDQDNNLMNITFRTNASGIWSTIGINSSQPNGTYTQTYTFDSPNQIYYWSVHCTDGKSWINTTYTFTTKHSAGLWWDTNWQYRKGITVNHGMVECDLINFPVLIDVTDSDLQSYAQENGDDIIFTDYNGVKLAHEIELFNHITGRVICWVNVTSLSGSVDTILYMYYGNPDCSSQENPTGVWNSNYMMVQHLSETSGLHADSTSYDNDGTCVNGTNQNAVGYIDGADGFDGTNDWINCGNDDSLDLPDAMTLEVWVKRTGEGTSNYQGIISRAEGGTEYINRYQLRYKPADNVAQFFLRDSSGYVVISSDMDISLNEWTHLAATWDGTNMRLYVDGVQQTQTNIFTGTPTFTSANLELGRYTGMNYFGGVIDEIKISNTSKESCWIKTEYNNQKDQSTFYSLESQETAPQVGYHYQISLNQAWNLVSLPVNESTPKLNITVSYLGVNYSWQQAVTAGVILDSIYGWDATGQSYDLTTILLPGHGYWVYAYSTCTFWISSYQLNTDLSITELGVSWNLVGVPVNRSVAKTNLTVMYEGVPYTWQQAVTAGVILDSIYGWNAAGQNYDLATVLQPSQGYWMYAYHACRLNREEG